MRTAKSYKLILLTLALIMSLMAALMLVPGKSAQALSVSSDPKAYFQVSKEASVHYANDSVEATVKNGSFFRFYNSVIVNDLGYEFTVSDNISKVEFKFDTSSKYENGNKLVKEDGSVSYAKEVTHALAIEFNSDSMLVTFNGVEKEVALSRDIKLVFNVNGNVLSLSVNGCETISSEDEYYLVKNIGGTPINDTRFDFIVTDGEDGLFSLKSVDQKVSDTEGTYKQTFELENDKVKTIAKPRAKLNDGIYTQDGLIKIKNNVVYSVTFYAYSIFGDSYKNSMSIASYDEGEGQVAIWFGNKDLPNSFCIKEEGDFVIDETIKLQIKSQDFETVEVLDNIVLYNSCDETPVYNNDQSAKESFEQALLKATRVTDSVTGEETYVRLGEKLTIPSLKDMIQETSTPYNYMDFTVYYMTPTVSFTSTSKLEIPIDNAGDYKFFVVFKDAFGNKLEQSDFYSVDEEDDNKIEEGEYYDYLFTFHIEDDAPISVKAAESQGEGFLNVKYLASSFDIKAYGYSTVYTLFYNEDVEAEADDEGWKKIIKKVDLKDSYEDDYFTKEDITAINYDGELTFTPNKIGAYKIECRVTSTHSTRAVFDETVIKVENKAQIVKNAVDISEWIGNNVWSVVFLSVGVVCFIAIIVLVCVKPKTDEDAE